MAIADIHEDIIKTNILTRLDGQTLAAAGCASSQLQSLCSDHKLWSDICSSNWQSTNDPLVTNIISNFPSSYRSFYSDVFPSPTNCHLSVTSVPPTTQIISSVDLKYNDKLIFSKVESTNTTPSDWFQTSPFRIDLLEPKELISSTMKLSNDQDILLSNLENHMTLSWIMIDPTQNRAVNLSSVKPVSVQRNWLTTDIELTFAIVMKHDHNQYINCNILVTCGVKQGGEEVNVSGVSLTIVDMDGKCLSGKDSMVILQGLNAAKRRCNGSEGRKERYDEYIQRKRERNEKTERRERRLDMACVASGVALVMAFWSFAIC
ncbi:F-box protein-like protein [Tanacetum coccineum]